MKTLFLSDIHVDFHWKYAVGPKRLYVDDPDELVTPETMDYIWDYYQIPFVDRLVLAGDYSNDFLTFTRMIPWLAKKYKEVYLVLGNHDLTVRGGTPSKSNLPFVSSEKKIDEMKAICKMFDNIYLLDGEVINGIGGCMGMCDFKCEPPQFGLDPFTNWKRHWYDGKFWRYMNQEPRKIWDHYEQKLNDIVKQKPKIIVTHFVPYELGIPFEYRNNSWNYVFYFKGEKFFEELDNDTYWVCGHVHGKRMAEYVNSKGNHIHIMCNPIGYPGERSLYCDIVDYTGSKIERSSKVADMNDYIIDV
jgi:Icc-related predicted phosphoesterase